MKLCYAVLEILEEGRRTGRNVERKTRIFVHFNYESSENGNKKICIVVSICWQIETLPARCSVRRPPS